MSRPPLLVFGTLYGAIAGHGLGMFIAVFYKRFDEYNALLFGLCSMVIGIMVGVVSSLYCESRFRVERRSAIYPKIIGPNRMPLSARLWLVLVLLVMCYLLLLPALNFPRE